MEYAQLSRIVNDIELSYLSASSPPTYFDCLEALDQLELHVLDFMDQSYSSSEMESIRDQAMRLHSRLSSIAQDSIDKLLEDIYQHRLVASALKQVFSDYADSISDKLSGDEPDYDLFDDFLNQLFYIDYEPSETYARTAEMLYLQPTPGRIILEMIKELNFTEADCFYDLGSGLGRVPILVSLLTNIPSVGVEYEPSYVHYSRGSAQKLGINNVEFRNQDACDADFSAGTIFFMYTPFTGSILRNVLDRLQELSKTRAITLCTYGPCTPMIEQETWLNPIRASKGEIHRLAIFRSVE